MICKNIVMHACYLPHPPTLTNFEIQRNVRVNRNNGVYFALKMPTLSTEVRNSKRCKSQEESE